MSKKLFLAAQDIVDRVDIVSNNLPAMNTDMKMKMNKEFVALIVCFAYKERDLLIYSSPCITIAALAIDTLYRKDLKSFDDILCKISSPVFRQEVSKCSRILYDKVMSLPFFSESDGTMKFHQSTN